MTYYMAEDFNAPLDEFKDWMVKAEGSMRRLSVPLKILIGVIPVLAGVLAGALVWVIVWIFHNVRIVSNLRG
jgi:hypothetical protein